MTQASMLPPRVSFAREAETEIQATRMETVPFDNILAIHHPGGHARIRIAALELRQAAPDRWQLHVLNFDRGQCLSTSRGVFLVLSDAEAAEVHALGVPKREKSTLPKSWKPGIVAVREGETSEEKLGSLRGPHGIVKSSWVRTSTGKEHRWTEHGYDLIDLATGEPLFRNKRRNACEAESDRLLS